jgi:putative oxidoreductase
MNKYLSLVARLLLAQIYLIVGLYAHVYQSMTNPVFYSGFQQYLGSVGLPGVFAPLMILVEVLGAVLLLVGFKTRFAAYLLAGYSVFIALVFHNNLGNPQELLACLQYLAVAGGMLAIAANPDASCSLDGLFARK